MATLTNGRITVTVPDDLTEDYLKQGWRRPGEPAPAHKKRRTRKATTTAAKPARAKTTAAKPAAAKTTAGGSDDAHAVRADRHPASPKADA